MTKNQHHYFAKNGSYGSADEIVILDTADWPKENLDYRCADRERHEIAQRIMLGYGSIDQQDCPMMLLDATFCEFSGPVYRHFQYPDQGDSGGYFWDCPDCGADNHYEGD